MIWLVPEQLTEPQLLFGEAEAARVARGTVPISKADCPLAMANVSCAGRKGR